MNIYLEKERFITNRGLSCDAVMAYIALRMIQNGTTNDYYINSGLLAYQLFDSLSVTRKYMERLNAGLDELIKKRYVSVVSKTAKEYILDLSGLVISNGDDKKTTYFVTIESGDIHTIMTLDSRLDKFAILHYFACVLSTISSTTTLNDYYCFVGFMTMDYIGSLCGISSRTTIDKYNKLLEDNCLLYIYRHTVMIRDEKGQFKNIPNHYGRFADRNLIIEYAVNREKFDTKGEVVEKRSNQSRSLMQKYHSMVKNGTVYTEREIRDIYKYIHYRNIQSKKESERLIEQGFDGSEPLAKIQSEEIFKQYDFLKNDKSTPKTVCKIRTFSSPEQSSYDDIDIWGEVDKLDAIYKADETEPYIDVPIEW